MNASAGRPGRAEPFADRGAAGDALALRLLHHAGRADVVVLGLPRGGVPVAARVAAALHAPLDVLVVRKLGLPRQPELAMGAIAGVGEAVEVIRNEFVLARAGTTAEAFEAVYRREAEELRRRQREYRGDRKPVQLAGRTAIVVDDGVATGSTMRAAVAALRHRGPGHQNPARIVVAVPIGSARTCHELAECADEVVCVRMPEPFFAVGEGYRDFRQTGDGEVRRLLRYPRAKH